MSPLLGFFHAVFALLAASGSLKLIRPGAASRALRAAQLLPIGRRLVAHTAARLLGAVEIALGLIGLAVPLPGQVTGALLAVTGLLFVGFNLFLRRLHRIDASADCGCFGGAGGSGMWHRNVNTGIASSLGLAAALALLVPGATVHRSLLETMVSLVAESPVLVVTYGALVVMLAWVLTVGPGLLDDLADARAVQA